MKKLIILFLLFSGCSIVNKFEYLDKMSTPLKGKYFALDREIIINSPSFTWTKYQATGSTQILERQEFQIDNFVYDDTESANQVITQSYLLTIKDSIGIRSTHSYIVKRNLHNPDEILSISLYLTGPQPSETLYIFVE